MSNDRYERIRAALAMNPTPGPWDGDDNSVSRLWSNGSVGIREYIALPDSAEDSTPNPANMHFIAACDPDTIRELLEERDELAKLVAEMRGTLRDLRIHLHAAGRRPEECYEMSMIDDALHLAAIDKARGKGEP